MMILNQRKQPNMNKSVAHESKDKKIMPSKTLKIINHTIFSKSPSKSGLDIEKKAVISTNEVYNNFNTTENYTPKNNYELFNRLSNDPKLWINYLKSINARTNLKTKKKFLFLSQ
jgi:hypothetical protein